MQHSDIDVRGCKVHVRRGGKGEPLLFLHGAQGLSGDEPGLEALTANFDVIAPDHPGFGQSDLCEAVDDVGDLAFFYLDLLDALKLDRVHVVGQCIGGWIAVEMAIRSTARIASLVLVNSAGLRVKGVPRADMFVCSEDELLKLLFAGNGAKAWLQSWRATTDHGGHLRSQPRARRRATRGRRGCAIRSSTAGCTGSTCRPISSGARTTR